MNGVKDKIVHLYLALFFFSFEICTSQERQLHIGLSAGMNFVPTPSFNLIPPGGDLSLSLFFQTRGPFGLQLEPGWSRTYINMVAARIDKNGVRGSYSYKPRYSAWRLPLWISYTLKRSTDTRRKRLLFGASLDRVSLDGYLYGSRAWKGSLQSYEELTEPGEGSTRYTAHISLAYSLLRRRKRTSRCWTLSYEKAVLRAPTFHAAGNIYFNYFEKRPFSITKSPYLDGLALRYTVYFIKAGVQ